MVIVKFDDGFKATIDGYKWQAEPGWFQDMLNLDLDPDGPTGWDPDPDYNAALAAIEMYGGKVVKHDKLERVKGRVY